MAIATIPFLAFGEELPEVVRRELDQYTAKLRRFLLVSLNEDGTLRTNLNNDNPNIVINNETTEGSGDGKKQQWDAAGPWTLDNPYAELDNVVGLRPPDPPAGSYNDYAPPGIDDAVAVEIEPQGDITLTGIKRMTLQARKRMLLLRNRDSSNTITLTHQDPLSLEGNRFDLPGGVDIILAGRQNVWLYYDISRAAWTAAITAQAQGGLNEGGAGGGDVVGPASAVNDNIATFDGTTGKLIKDSGVSVTTIALGSNLFIATANLGTFKTGLTSPVTLAAAPGAGFTVVPLVWNFIQSASDDQFIQNAPITISMRYSSVTNKPFGTLQISNALNRYTYFRMIASELNFGAGTGKPGPPAATVDPHNQSVVISADKNIDYTGGGGVSEGSFKTSLIYTIDSLTNPVAT